MVMLNKQSCHNKHVLLLQCSTFLLIKAGRILVMFQMPLRRSRQTSGTTQVIYNWIQTKESFRISTWNFLRCICPDKSLEKCSLENTGASVRKRERALTVRGLLALNPGEHLRRWRRSTLAPQLFYKSNWIVCEDDKTFPSSSNVQHTTGNLGKTLPQKGLAKE